MARFRKLPVEIEARQFDGSLESAMLVLDWIHSHKGEARRCTAPSGHNGLAIRTLEGTMVVEPDDWVIQGVKGEFYPCKPEIFASTYEAVDTTPEEK